MRRGQQEAAQNEFQGVVQHKALPGSQGAAIVPDVDAAEAQVFVLGAAATVGVPLVDGAAVSANNVPIGTKLFLVFVQDVTAGRALSWNAIFRGAPATTGGAATNGQRMGCEFRYDGASWQFVGGASTFA